MEKRHCQYCDGVIAGRTDKKFCNDACRNAFHNEKLSLYLKKVSPVVQVLKRNHAILRQVMERGNPVSKEELLMMGFVQQYCTEHMRYDNSDHYFCFDVGFRDDGDRVHVLARSELSQHLAQLPAATIRLIQEMGEEQSQSIRRKL
jgi:hypothetical protein